MSNKDAHELFVLNLVLVISVLETLLGLLNNLNDNFLYNLGEALNNHIIFLELVVDLVANTVEIRVDIIAETASVVLQINVLALLSLREWISGHSVIDEDELPSFRQRALSK